MKSALTLVVLLLALPAAPHAAELAKSPVNTDTRPNVMLIILEDWGPFLGCYGEKEMFTPNLDKLASEGIRYNYCFSSAPVCSTGRSSLMTGVSQYTTHCQDHRTKDKQPLPAGIKSVMELFKEAGYFTALGCGVGDKVDLNFKMEPDAYMGDDWKERKPGQPFYAHFTYMGTHRSWGHDPSHPIDPAKVTLPAWYPDTPLTRKDWAMGLESAQVSDRRFGEIIARLKKEGI
jgi:arylsulfatase A-like enzyme